MIGSAPPPAPSLDGEYDAAGNLSSLRGKGCYFRVEGKTVFDASYRDGCELESCVTYAEAKANIESGQWTRLTPEEKQRFSACES